MCDKVTNTFFYDFYLNILYYYYYYTRLMLMFRILRALEKTRLTKKNEKKNIQKNFDSEIDIGNGRAKI